MNKKRFSQYENSNALPFRRRLVRSFNKAFKGFVCKSDGPGSLLKTLRLSRKEATTVCGHVVAEVAVELAQVRRHLTDLVAVVCMQAGAGEVEDVAPPKTAVPAKFAAQSST